MESHVSQKTQDMGHPFFVELTKGVRHYPADMQKTTADPSTPRIITGAMIRSGRDNKIWGMLNFATAAFAQTVPTQF